MQIGIKIHSRLDCGRDVTKCRAAEAGTLCVAPWRLPGGGSWLGRRLVGVRKGLAATWPSTVVQPSSLVTPVGSHPLPLGSGPLFPFLLAQLQGE